MAFPPPEYCRLFAQKKAYQGGVTGTPGPPLATPLKRAIQNSKKRDQSLLTFLRRKDEEDNPKGETLPEDMRLFRFDLVEAFLSAGIPLSKIDHLRSFLERNMGIG